MNLKSLLQSFSRVTTVIGPAEEVMRLTKGATDPKLRKVNVRVASVTITRSFMWPWMVDQVVQALNVEAEARSSTGQVFSSAALLRLDVHRAIDYVTLDIVKQVTLANMQRLRAELQAVGA